MEGAISILMPSKIYERVQSVQVQQTGRQSVLLRNVVTLSHIHQNRQLMRSEMI